MTNSFLKNAGRFSAFRSASREKRDSEDTDDSSYGRDLQVALARTSAALARERDQGTATERRVLALELIADQLHLIAQEFVRLRTRHTNEAAAGDAPATDGDCRAGDRWENEGGHLHPEPVDTPQIKRTLVEHFSVGGYNYTKLELAILQAKRARREST